MVFTNELFEITKYNAYYGYYQKERGFTTCLIAQVAGDGKTGRSIISKMANTAVFTAGDNLYP